MGRRRSITAALLALGLFLAAGAQAAKIGRISLRESGRVLEIETGAKVEPRLVELKDRLVIVVPGGEHVLKTIPVGSKLVDKIRFGVDGKDLRIVVDLKAPLHAHLGKVGDKGFLVELEPAIATAVPAAPKNAPGAVPTAAPAAVSAGAAAESLSPAQTGYTYRILDLALSGDERHTELVVSADGPANYKTQVREDGKLLSVIFRNSSLAWSGDASTLKDDAVAQVSARTAVVGGESQVRLDVHLNQKLAYALRRDQNQLVLSLDRPLKSETGELKGDMEALVSLDVQDADLVGVIKTLCEQAGFEYQFTKSILQKTPPDSLVTVKVDKHPFREVVDTLLAAVQARALRQGNTIFVGSESETVERRNRLPVVTKTYRPRYLTFKQLVQYILIQYYFDDSEKNRIKGIVRDPRDPGAIMLVGADEEVAAWIQIMKKYDVPDSSGDGDDADSSVQRTQVFHLQYLDNSNASLITGAIAQLYPDGETVPTPLIDAGTRTMVVTTTGKYLRKIEKLLATIDVKPQQVNIEGKIVEVDQGVTSQLGVNWTGNSTSNATNQASFNSEVGQIFTSQLTYGTIANGLNITAQLNALAQESKADIVSAPNITTEDNQAATISATDVQVYTQSTTTISNGVVTVANTFPTSNIPLTLIVTPKISALDRRILMNINFQLTVPNGNAPVSGAPVPTSQQSALTNVVVRNGETAVLGGLVRQDNTETVDKVPVLGDIPLIGLLFRFKQVAKTKKEVIIFITPTIVEN